MTKVAGNTPALSPNQATNLYHSKMSATLNHEQSETEYL